jgi:hypothetical protein
MFVQLIRGRVKDGETLRKQFDRWSQDLKPGAEGYLGSTAGITDEGEFFATARFETEEAARRNSDRREQGEWWEETSACFEGEATFRDYTDVDVGMGGGSDDSGFVQGMQGSSKDMKKTRELEKRFDKEAQRMRPDVLGTITCWDEDGGFFSVAYFTSEEEARKGESQEPPPEAAEMLEHWQSMMGEMRYFDIREPWLDSK